MRALSIFSLVMLSSVIVQAQERIEPADVIRHVAVLAHDSMAGRRTGTPGGAMARAYLVRALTDIGLEKVGTSYEHSFAFSSDTATRRGVNLVALVPGRVRKDRYIVVTAHYDHLGTRQEQIYNGADDNASGTAALLELARQLKRRPADHSVLFVALDGEESGLRGARAFVAAPPIPLGSIALNINMDMIGRNAKNELYAAGATSYPFLRPYLDSVAARSAITLRLGHDDPKGPPQDDWTSQSDQGAFHAAKIPFVYFGVEDHPDYHKPTDDIERIMPSFLAGAANTVLATLRILDANLARVIERSPSR